MHSLQPKQQFFWKGGEGKPEDEDDEEMKRKKSSKHCSKNNNKNSNNNSNKTKMRMRMAVTMMMMTTTTMMTVTNFFVGCLTSQQHASVSQGRICSDNCTCCHTEIEVADQTFHLTQSQYTATGPTSPSADPITPGAWQGSHWSANV